jgi:uncharacterized protein YutE (UPF0331/DUF86 family)
VVSREILQIRLNRLGEYRRVLADLTGVPLERFVSDPREHAAAERYLQLSAECMIDIASHLVADLGLPVAQTYSELFERLGDSGELDRDLAARLAVWARFRNVLVHGYVELDLSIVHATLCRDLGDIDDFMAACAKYLDG